MCFVICNRFLVFRKKKLVGETSVAKKNVHDTSDLLSSFLMTCQDTMKTTIKLGCNYR